MACSQRTDERHTVANKYTELFYHFVWAAKKREHLISLELEPHLFRYIRHKCRELKVIVHALNGMPDHLHLACSLPPTLSISDFMETIKGSSAHFVNHMDGKPYCLYWQTGYGALTFSKRDLPKVIEYICNQKQHHASGTLFAKMEPSSASPEGGS